MTRTPTLLARLVLPFALMILAAPASAQCVGDPPDVVGSWEWTMSVGGIAGDTRTPATEGYTWQLEFRDDGTMTSYLNEEFEYVHPWSVECRECSLPDGWRWCFSAGEPFAFATAVMVRLSPRELECGPVDVIDGYGHAFVPRGPVVPEDPDTLGRIKILYR